MVDESAKLDLVLDAAQSQFIRYGFKRVTMGEIAAAADMSRPALYLLYSNKEAIFVAVFERFIHAALNEIRAGLKAHDDLTSQLRFALDIWTVRPYELLAQSPDARELIDCTHGFAEQVAISAYEEFEAIIARLIKPHARNLRATKLTAAKLAHLFALALRGIKDDARDVDELRSSLEDLIAVTVLTVRPATAQTKLPPTSKPRRRSAA